uniref:Uncharacterized protein n=1 Tax=Branchiostoma floridae TaxID=7739 RepID=C3YBC1_BRAFL|eukprot:XP_002606268.1 hypothetical protein BRAFLDRAFT_83980 [Branchiostoma floridae]
MIYFGWRSLSCRHTGGNLRRFSRLALAVLPTHRGQTSTIFHGWRSLSCRHTGGKPRRFFTAGARCPADTQGANLDDFSRLALAVLPTHRGQTSTIFHGWRSLSCRHTGGKPRRFFTAGTRCPADTQGANLDDFSRLALAVLPTHKGQTSTIFHGWHSLSCRHTGGKPRRFFTAGARCPADTQGANLDDFSRLALAVLPTHRGQTSTIFHGWRSLSCRHTGGKPRRFFTAGTRCPADTQGANLDDFSRLALAVLPTHRGQTSTIFPGWRSQSCRHTGGEPRRLSPAGARCPADTQGVHLRRFFPGCRSLSCRRTWGTPRRFFPADARCPADTHGAHLDDFPRLALAVLPTHRGQTSTIFHGWRSLSCRQTWGKLDDFSPADARSPADTQGRTSTIFPGWSSLSCHEHRGYTLTIFPRLSLAPLPTNMRHTSTIFPG